MTAFSFNNGGHSRMPPGYVNGPVKRILDTELWARSWSRCTGSQPAGDRKSSTRW